MLMPIVFGKVFMVSLNVIRLALLGKAALIGACTAVISSLALAPAQAQSPRIIVQCVPPLVPNEDGTDCVHPPAQAKTCPDPTLLREGRCMEPNRYDVFTCEGSFRRMRVAYYLTNEVAIFIEGSPRLLAATSNVGGQPAILSNDGSVRIAFIPNPVPNNPRIMWSSVYRGNQKVAECKGTIR